MCHLEQPLNVNRFSRIFAEIYLTLKGTKKSTWRGPRYNLKFLDHPIIYVLYMYFFIFNFFIYLTICFRQSQFTSASSVKSIHKGFLGNTYGLYFPIKYETFLCQKGELRNEENVGNVKVIYLIKFKCKLNHVV